MKYDTFIFDLDDTLSESKSAITPEMAEALRNLLAHASVAIITGGMISQIIKQVVDHLPEPSNLSSLYLLPTSGGSLHTWDDSTKSWEKQYDSNLPDGTFTNVERIFEDTLPQYNDILDIPRTLYGPQLEDRGSQISFSALGQQAPSDIKKKWDPDHRKRLAILPDLEAALPDLEVRIGGTTTIDISLKGRDKAYGITQLYEYTGSDISRGLFIGDSIFPGGNDYAATKTEITTQKTSSPEETIRMIQNYLQSN
jgi:phosphomannomutase